AAALASANDVPTYGSPNPGGMIGSLAFQTNEGFVQDLVHHGWNHQDAAQAASSFIEGSVTPLTLDTSIKTARVYGGGSSKLGLYHTFADLFETPRGTLALPPANAADRVGIFESNIGARAYIGKVAPSFGQPGGGTQILFTKESDACLAEEWMRRPEP